METSEHELARLRREIAVLRDREDFLRLSQRIASIGSWSWDFATGRLDWSEELSRIFGISSAKFDGTLQSAIALLHPDDRERAEQAVAEAMEDRAPPASEYRIVRPEGMVRWVWAGGRLVRDGSGRPLRLVGTILDVTERKRAERALRDSDERLRLALSAAKMGTWELHATSGEMSGSAQARTILARETGGFPTSWEAYLELVHAEDRKTVRDAVRRALFDADHGDDCEIEHRITRSGGTGWVLVKGRAFRNPHGRPVKLAGVLMDVSERRRLETELLRSQKLDSIGRLAGGIAHDFNNLLTVILGALEAAMSMAENPAIVHSSLETIRSTTEEASRLTAQLLAFAGKQVIRLESVEPNALVADVERLLRRIVGEDIELRTQLARDLWNVRADASQLSQVLMSLATNAREAMPTGGRLELETSNVTLDEASPDRAPEQQPGDYVRLSVRDTGPGMDERSQSHAFDPFFTESGGGRGLGLASSYGIAKQIGGYLSVRSDPGRGTTFVLDLPRTVERASEGPRRVDDCPAEPETVLVVEDDPGVRSLLVQGLVRHGHRVLEAPDGETALDVFARHRDEIDIVVTDTVMPGIRGTELARRVREAKPETKLLLISGYADDLAETDEVEGLAFLQKPFTPNVLARKLRELTGG